MRVRGTQLEVKSVEQFDTKVLVRTNIVRIDDPDTELNPGFHGWEYDEVELTISEYQELQKQQVESLESKDLDNKEAIAELYEMVLS